MCSTQATAYRNCRQNPHHQVRGSHLQCDKHEPAQVNNYLGLDNSRPYLYPSMSMIRVQTKDALLATQGRYLLYWMEQCGGVARYIHDAGAFWGDIDGRYRANV